MVKLIHQFSGPLAQTVMVREQLGLALNRLKWRDEAQQVLLKFIDERGPCSETLRDSRPSVQRPVGGRHQIW